MFFKYPSLVNHYAIGRENRIVQRLDELWIATEKIHGANASYIIDKEGSESFAKRTSLINSEDKQFNQLPSCVSDSIKNSAKAILEDANADYVIVYGEYFGSGIQKMDYDIVKSGEKTFKVFDVLVHKHGDSKDKFTVLSNGMFKYFSLYDLAPIVSTSKTLREYLNDEMDDDSLLGGYKEGLVYKPSEPYEIDENHRYVGVKRKTEKYLEKEKVSTKIPKSKPDFSIVELNIQKDLGKYITQNRLNNILSHGEFDLIPQNIGKIMLSFREDVIKEFTDENEVSPDVPLMKLIAGYSSDIAKIIKDKIGEESSQLLQQ